METSVVRYEIALQIAPLNLEKDMKQNISY